MMCKCLVMIEMYESSISVSHKLSNLASYNQIRSSNMILSRKSMSTWHSNGEPVLCSSVLVVQPRAAFPAAESTETVRETASARTSKTTSSSRKHPPPLPPCVSMVGFHSNPCLPLQCQLYEVDSVLYGLCCYPSIHSKPLPSSRQTQCHHCIPAISAVLPLYGQKPINQGFCYLFYKWTKGESTVATERKSNDDHCHIGWLVSDHSVLAYWCAVYSTQFDEAH